MQYRPESHAKNTAPDAVSEPVTDPIACKKMRGRHRPVEGASLRRADTVTHPPARIMVHKAWRRWRYLHLKATNAEDYLFHAQRQKLLSLVRNRVMTELAFGFYAYTRMLRVFIPWQFYANNRIRSRVHSGGPRRPKSRKRPPTGDSGKPDLRTIALRRGLIRWRGLLHFASLREATRREKKKWETRLECQLMCRYLDDLNIEHVIGKPFPLVKTAFPAVDVPRKFDSIHDQHLAFAADLEHAKVLDRGEGYKAHCPTLNEENRLIDEYMRFLSKTAQRGPIEAHLAIIDDRHAPRSKRAKPSSPRFDDEDYRVSDDSDAAFSMDDRLPKSVFASTTTPFPLDNSFPSRLSARPSRRSISPPHATIPATHSFPQHSWSAQTLPSSGLVRPTLSRIVTSPGSTQLRQESRGFVPSRQDSTGFALSRQDSGGMAPSRQESGGLALSRQDSGGLGPLRQDSGGLDPLRQDSGGIAPSRLDSGGMTPLRQESGGLAPSWQVSSGTFPRSDILHAARGGRLYDPAKASPRSPRRSGMTASSGLEYPWKRVMDISADRNLLHYAELEPRTLVSEPTGAEGTGAISCMTPVPREPEPPRSTLLRPTHTEDQLFFPQRTIEGQIFSPYVAHEGTPSPPYTTYDDHTPRPGVVPRNVPPPWEPLGTENQLLPRVSEFYHVKGGPLLYSQTDEAWISRGHAPTTDRSFSSVHTDKQGPSIRLSTGTSAISVQETVYQGTELQRQHMSPEAVRSSSCISDLQALRGSVATPPPLAWNQHRSLHEQASVGSDPRSTVAESSYYPNVDTCASASPTSGTIRHRVDDIKPSSTLPGRRGDLPIPPSMTEPQEVNQYSSAPRVSHDSPMPIATQKRYEHEDGARSSTYPVTSSSIGRLTQLPAQMGAQDISSVQDASLLAPYAPSGTIKRGHRESTPLALAYQVDIPRDSHQKTNFTTQSTKADLGYPTSVEHASRIPVSASPSSNATRPTFSDGVVPQSSPGLHRKQAHYAYDDEYATMLATPTSAPAMHSDGKQLSDKISTELAPAEWETTPIPKIESRTSEIKPIMVGGKSILDTGVATALSSSKVASTTKNTMPAWSSKTWERDDASAAPALLQPRLPTVAPALGGSDAEAWWLGMEFNENQTGKRSEYETARRSISRTSQSQG
eukprot:GEMP01000864.1.p1 GENE.GEMP01000864.1~~GEMP01000864.1.p1  ORF type:complete len:1153 (+),score=251.08 GEMP01000864.1:1771-5229(+)